METVNGVSDGDKGAPPPPSPLTGCYLLIVIGEPHCSDHKDIILQRVAKGLLSWDLNECLVDLEKELAIITEQALEGEEARYGERLIQFASENLVTEILIHPVVSTLAQCVRNLLSSFTRHRHIIHSGYTFANNGSWVLQDGTFSLADFSEAFQELEVLRVIRAYENGISLDIHCSPEGDWTRLPKESFTKSCKVKVNPNDVLTSGSPSITSFINYIEPFLVPAELDSILESSDVVGNIRFSRPTLYVFPGGQGDAALFGINGFNMLLDGGFSRKACFWDFVRHLDRLDAVLLTRLNNSNVSGISAVLRRKKQNALYPQIGHFFCNIQERKAVLSPDGDKDKDPLLINLLEEGQEIVTNLRHLSLNPQVCYRDSEPINLYHKVGHGTLDMYVLSPAKDSKEVREFLQKWNNNDQKLFANQKSRDFVFPLQNLVSICALLVWQPANPDDTITRILFPGSSPQNKIFEGLDRIKSLEFVKHPVCSEKSLAPVSVIKSKVGILDKILPLEKKSLENKKPKVFEKTTDNALNENELKNDDVNGVQTEKTVKKSDSTESEKSISKPKKVIENGDKSKFKKPEPKPKLRSDSQQRKIKSADKKPSPTTPKKSIEKHNEDTKEKPRPKASPSATPAKSAKEANNRKVVESKIKTSSKKEPPKSQVKTERKPISRRPKDATKAVASPTKKVNGIQKPDSISRRGKLDKEGTTDSSTVSTPSADQDSILKKDISKLTPDELQNLKAQELADLKEEQEAVKEIEAVFRKGEQQQDKPSNFRKIKNLSIDDKLESEEYLIIEKTEIDQDSKQEDETQKHTRDSEESEKQRKLSEEILKVDIVSTERHEIQDEVQKIITSAADIVKIKDEIEMSKEVSAATPEDKIDVSTDKKITDKDNEDDIKETAPESQPEEKGSGNAESGATTTAPTLPEDERIPLDEIKEHHPDQAVEEKHVKEDTKEKDVPVIQLPQKMFENVTKLPPVVGIRLDKQSHIRDIVKTPDEVADLPVHEEVDIDHYDVYGVVPESKPEVKQTDDAKKEIDLDRDAAVTDDYDNKEKELDFKQSTIVQPKLDKSLENEDMIEKPPTIKIGEDHEEEPVDLNKKEISKSPEEEKDTDEHELQNKSPVSPKKVIEDQKLGEEAPSKMDKPHAGLEDKTGESTVKTIEVIHSTHEEEKLDTTALSKESKMEPTQIIDSEEKTKTQEEKLCEPFAAEVLDEEKPDITALYRESKMEATQIIDSVEKTKTQEEKHREPFAAEVLDEEVRTKATSVMKKPEETIETKKEERSHETVATEISKEEAKIEATTPIIDKTEEEIKPKEIEKLTLAAEVSNQEAKIEATTPIIDKTEEKTILEEEEKSPDVILKETSSEEEKIKVTAIIDKLEEKTESREQPLETIVTKISSEGAKVEATPTIDKPEDKIKPQEEEKPLETIVTKISSEEAKVEATPTIDKSEEKTKPQEEEKPLETVVTKISSEEARIEFTPTIEKTESRQQEKPLEKIITETSSEETKIETTSIIDKPEEKTKPREEEKLLETIVTQIISEEEKVEAMPIIDQSEKKTEPGEQDKSLKTVDTVMLNEEAKVKATPIIDKPEEKTQEQEKLSEVFATELSDKKEMVKAAHVIDKLEEKTKAQEQEKSSETFATEASGEEDIVKATHIIDKTEEKSGLQEQEKSSKTSDTEASGEEVIVKTTHVIDKAEEKSGLQKEEKPSKTFDTEVSAEEEKVQAAPVSEMLEKKKETHEEEPSEPLTTAVSDKKGKIDTKLDHSEDETKTEEKEKIHETSVVTVSKEEEKMDTVSKEETKEDKPTSIDKLIDESSYTSIADDFDEDEFPEMPQYEAVGREMEKDTEKITETSKHDEDERIQIVKETKSGIADIDEKLQKLKDKAETQRRQSLHEIVTIDHKVQEPEHAEPVVIASDSKPESPVIEEVLTLEDKMELGRKSPKEREGDVAKIVASVAVVLKSDAPLEEFEGKIPLLIPYKGYTTELRETHITTVDSPITDDHKSVEPAVEETICPKSLTTSFLEQERKIEPIHEEDETKISKMMKDSNELIQATSRMISDIKQTQQFDDVKEEEEVSTVHRMLVTASSEDGGEETEICPPGTIIFSKSSESSGRSSPDNLSQKVSQKSSTAETSSDATTIAKPLQDSTLEKELVIDAKVTESEVNVKKTDESFHDDSKIVESKIQDLESNKNAIDDFQSEDVKKLPKDKTLDDNIQLAETLVREVNGKEPEDVEKVQSEAEVGKLEKVVDTPEGIKDESIRSKENINESITLQMQEAKEIKTETEKCVKDVDLEENVATGDVKHTAEIETVENKERLISEVKDVKEDSNKEISKNLTESKESIETEKEEVIEKLDDGKDDLSKKSVIALDSKLNDPVKEISHVKENNIQEEPIHKTDEKIIEKSIDKKFDLLNGLEEVGEMAVDIVTADREVVKSSPECSLEQNRLDEKKDSGLVDKLEEEMEHIVEKGIEEVKELAEGVKSVFRRRSSQLQEETLEKAAHDIEKNYDIVSDIAKSVVFIKCDNKLEEEEIKKEEQFLENSGRDIEENYETVTNMTKSMVFETCEKPEDLELRRDEAVLDKAAHDIEENYQIVSDMAKSVVFDKCDKPGEVERRKEEKFLEKSADDVEKGYEIVSDMAKSVVFEKCDKPLDNKETYSHEPVEVHEKVEKEKELLPSTAESSIVHRIVDNVENLIEDGADEIKELVGQVVGSLFREDDKEKSSEAIVETVTEASLKEGLEKHTQSSTVVTDSKTTISADLHDVQVSPFAKENQLNGDETETVGDLKLSGKSTPESHSDRLDDGGKLLSMSDNKGASKEEELSTLTNDAKKETSGKSSSEVHGHDLKVTESIGSGKSSPVLLDDSKDNESIHFEKSTFGLNDDLRSQEKDSLVTEKESSGLSISEKKIETKSFAKLQFESEIDTKESKSSSPTLSDALKSEEISTAVEKVDITSKLSSSPVLQNKEDKKSFEEKSPSGVKTKEVELESEKITEKISSFETKEISDKSTVQGKPVAKDLELSSESTTDAKTEVEFTETLSSLPQELLPKSCTEADDQKKTVTLSGKSTPDLEKIIDTPRTSSTISEELSSMPVEVKEDKSSPDLTGKVSPNLQEPGLLQKIENEIEKGIEIAKETITAIIKDDSSIIEKEEKVLEKSAKDIEDNYEIVSEMSKSVLFEKCDLAEEKLMEKISSDKYEEILSKSAHDIEDNFEKVTDMSKSIAFDKCHSTVSKEEKIAEKSAQDIEENFKIVSDMSKSILFEKCETPSQISDKTDTKLLLEVEPSQKKLSVSDVEISLDENLSKSAIKHPEDVEQVVSESTEEKRNTEITASFLKEEIANAVEIPPKDDVAGPSTIQKIPSLIVAEENLHLSGKSTPDIADIIQETIEHEKHITGSSTPPTVPVSPTVKEISSEELKILKKTGLETTKEIDIRSATPGSDDYEIGVSTHSDISSGQASRAPHFESERIESDDDEDVPGSPMSMTSQVAHSRSSSRYDFDEIKSDHMSTSFYGVLPGDIKLDTDFEKTTTEYHETSSSSYLYEITKAKFSSSNTLHCDNAKLDQINRNEQSKDDDNLMTSSFIGELPSGTVKEPSDVWGKPLGLPSPAPPTDNRGTPKKERKLPANVTAKNKLNDDKKRSESPSKYNNKKKFSPIYVDLTYVPHHGNAYYSYVDFFKRVRARYYVFSGIEPSREVYNALLEAKQTWEDKELEVTIIPTYDTDILGYWVAENEELLTKYKIDLSPSASRCTINLQDHETSCSAYRLEF